VGKRAAFVGKRMAFVGKRMAFVGKRMAFVGKRMAFVGKRMAFVGKRMAFPLLNGNQVMRNPAGALGGVTIAALAAEIAGVVAGSRANGNGVGTPGSPVPRRSRIPKGFWNSAQGS
jgi:hypothetical protein